MIVTHYQCSQVLISDNHVDVKLRGGFLVGDRGGGAAGPASAAAVAAAAASVAGGGGGVTRYRARLLPNVDGGELVDLLAGQETVRRGQGHGASGQRGCCSYISPSQTARTIFGNDLRCSFGRITLRAVQGLRGRGMYSISCTTVVA